MKAADELDRVEKLRKDDGALKSAAEERLGDFVAGHPALCGRALGCLPRAHPRKAGAQGSAIVLAQEDATLLAIVQAF